MNSVTKNVTFDQVLDEKLKGKRFPIALMATLIIVGLLISYSHNSSPAPFIPYFFDFFQLDPIQDLGLINASMSVFLIITIPFTFIGTALEMKIGTRKLFTIAMLLNTIGILMVFASSGGSYGAYMAGRVIYGAGFGLAIPALGSAIMKWYRPKRRTFMTTLNGMFPLLGALIGYVVFPAVGQSVDNWIFGHGFSGFITLAVLIIWIIAVRKDVDTIDIASDEEEYFQVVHPNEIGNPIKWAFGTNQIRCLIVAFFCDFMMYMYVATILPTWLMYSGGMDEMTATTWAAIAFPAFGVIGVIIGGVLTNVLGKRKPIILFCQCLKLVGILVAALTVDTLGATGIILGIALFGLGNGGWMSPMFVVPTETPGTSASKVGAAYSVFMSFGFAAGFIFPIIGGLLATSFANSLTASTGITDTAILGAYGFKWSIFIFGLIHIIAIIAAIALKETGPGRKKKDTAAAEAPAA